MSDAQAIADLRAQVTALNAVVRLLLAERQARDRTHRHGIEELLRSPADAIEYGASFTETRGPTEAERLAATKALSSHYSVALVLGGNGPMGPHFR